MSAPPSASSAAPAAPRRWHPWPVGVALTIGVAMALNLSMVLIARRHAPVLVESGDAYARGLAWDQDRAAQAASKALGFTAELNLQGLQVRWRLQDGAGRPVTGRRGHLRAERADTAGLDFEVPLVEVAPGLYEATRPHAVGGAVRLLTRLEPSPPGGAAGGAPWLDERRAVLP